MLEAYGQALVFLFSPSTLLMMLAAVLVGLIIGILPGIGGMLGLALFLPFVFGMPKEIALTFLLAFHSVNFTGGGICSILLNVPGDGPSATALLDGFPMNQRGEGARAVAAGVTASSLGGLVPCFLALAMIPAILPIVMAFKSPEMAVLVLMGISFIATLTGRSVMKGLISGFIGVLISLIGIQGATGTVRFAFGSSYLYNGIGIVAVALGLFGISELLEMSLKGQRAISNAPVKSRLSDAFAGVVDVFRHWWLWLRCTILGYIIGVLPGVGAETSCWVSYAYAKRTSKHPDKFGTGVVEGVIAPQAANNAKEAGDLLTTMAFGIPGGASMSLVMGALFMVGVVPGPPMLAEHLPLALTLLLGIALANIMGGFIAFFSAPYLARIASLRFEFLFPLILCLVLAGGFVEHNTMMDVVVIIACGLLGLVMKKFEFSRPGLLLGVVMGKLLEDYTLLSIQIAGPFFFLTPICLILLAILVGLFAYPSLKKLPASCVGRLKKS